MWNSEKQCIIFGTHRKQNSLFIWNSNSTEHPVFYLAPLSGSHFMVPGQLLVHALIPAQMDSTSFIFLQSQWIFHWWRTSSSRNSWNLWAIPQENIYIQKVSISGYTRTLETIHGLPVKNPSFYLDVKCYPDFWNSWHLNICLGELHVPTSPSMLF